jgi:hypothetical protein
LNCSKDLSENSFLRLQHSFPVFRLTKPQKRKRIYWLGGLTAIIFTLLFVMSIIYHRKLSFNNTDSFELDSLVQDKIRPLEQCQGKTVFRVDHLITLFSSIVLFIVFSFFDKQERRGVLSPLELFRITNRYTTAIVTAIQSFEIFIAVEGLLIDANASSERGVLVKLAERIFIVMVIGYLISSCLILYEFY